MAAYIPTNSEDSRQMLEKIGVASVDELFESLPNDLLVDELDLPAGMSEMELQDFFARLGKKNKVYNEVWRGAGAYKHFIPAAVDEILSHESFVTSYTPYQAEISQGILQSIFEYQTSVCELTGLDVSNASAYDGASAFAEACRMTLMRKKDIVLLAGSIHPAYKKTAMTYFEGGDARFIEIPAGPDGLIDQNKLKEAMTDEVAAIALQQPNYLGLFENAKEINDLAHENDALGIMVVNPATLGVMATPADQGADIAVGDGQPFGMPLSFGGPYLGFMATTQKLTRQLPGRIVGQTTDTEGRRVFVLTLQAREQHIRREKASSNLCTNQALCAMRMQCFLSAIGPDGLERMGQLSYYNAHRLEEELAKHGYEREVDTTYFNEFVTTTPIPAKEVEAKLAKAGILSGLPLDENRMLWCATELNDERALNHLIAALTEEKEVDSCC